MLQHQNKDLANSWLLPLLKGRIRESDVQSKTLPQNLERGSMTALNYLSSLIQASSTEELIESFNQTIVFICSKIAQKYQSENKDIILQIKKFFCI